MSEIRANTISDAAGTGPVTLTKQSAAKVWLTITDNGLTPTVQSSINVSSIQDAGTGDVGINITSAMADTLYPIFTTNQYTTASGTGAFFNNPNNTTRTTSYYRCSFYQNGGTSHPIYWNIMNHGDLA